MYEIIYIQQQWVIPLLMIRTAIYKFDYMNKKWKLKYRYIVSRNYHMTIFVCFFRSICLGCFGRLDWEWWRQQSDLSKIFDPLRKCRCHYIEFVGDLTLTRAVATVYCVRQDLRLMAIKTNFEKKNVKRIHERFLVILDLVKIQKLF